MTLLAANAYVLNAEGANLSPVMVQQVLLHLDRCHENHGQPDCVWMTRRQCDSFEINSGFVAVSILTSEMEARVRYKHFPRTLAGIPIELVSEVADSQVCFAREGEIIAKIVNLSCA